MHSARIIKSVVLSLYALLCVFFLAAYLGAYVHPRTMWWLQIPAVVLPAVSLVLFAATLVFLWAPLRGFWWVHGIVLLAIVVRFSPWPDTFSTGNHDQPVLRVLTFNAKEVYPQDAYAVTKNLAEAHVPDIVALQGREINYQRARMIDAADPIRGFLSEDRYVAIRPENYRHGHFLSPVLIRIHDDGPTLVRKETIRLPETSQRVITRAEFEWQGTRFAVYNFHLHSFSLKPWRWSTSVWTQIEFLRYMGRTIRADFLLRTRQTEHIRNILDAEHLPYIVCGDFNSTPHNWSYRQIARGLTDVQSAGRILPRATYHARYPVVRIDHILLSPHWRVHSAEVLPRNFSDHFPLLAVLSLRSED